MDTIYDDNGEYSIEEKILRRLAREMEQDGRGRFLYPLERLKTLGYASDAWLIHRTPRLLRPMRTLSSASVT